MESNILTAVTARKCVSCGLCNSVCPINAIHMKYSAKTGFYVPEVMDTCINCGKCVAFCPALKKDKKKSYIGNAETISLVYSADQKVRKYGTSGGVVNEIIRFLLQSGMIDAALLVKKGHNEIESDTVIVTNEDIDDMLDNPREYASRYVTVPILMRLKELLGKENKIAIVGTPCQISAARRYIESRKEIATCIYLGIACSSGISYEATRQYKKMTKLEDAQFYYRGDGWPGKHMLLKDRECLTYTHPQSLFERMFSSQIFKNPGCYNCDDQFAEDADISFCDFWNDKELKSERIGKTCVLVRTDIGKLIIRDMLKSGVIKVSKEVSEKELVESQMAVLIQKKEKEQLGLFYKILKKVTRLIYLSNIYKLFSKREYDFLARAFSHVVWKSKNRNII